MRPTTTTLRLLPLLAAGSFFLGACGDDDTDTAAANAPAASTEEVTITIAEFAYDPIELTAAPGAEIAVTNDDTTAHTVTGKDGAFDSSSIAAGEAGSVTAPDEPGEYAYICSFHPFMKGTLTVE